MKITDVELTISAVRQSQYPDDNKPEFLLVGRSNVGKSTFINSIIERRNFARVSGKPGKTQTLNFYNVNNDFYLVDVPGYGYADVSKEKQRKFGFMIEEYIKDRKNLQCVFLIVDFRHKPNENDVLMYNFLKYYEIPTVIIANKLDKVKASSKEKNLKILKETLKLLDTDQVVLFSSVTKKGREDVYNILSSYQGDNEKE